jgi:hypothetical protein
MRKLQKRDHAEYNPYKDEIVHETLRQSSSGVMFDDDFVDALAQRLVQRMQTDLPDKARTGYSDTLMTLRLLLAVLSTLAFVAVIVIILKAAALAWWMMLAILSVAGTVFVLINIAFQVPRR